MGLLPGAALAMLLGLSTVAQVSLTDAEGTRLRLTAPGLSQFPFLTAVEATPAARQEQAALSLALEKSAGQDVMERADLLEAFVRDYPQSAWTPSLRLTLANRGFLEGQYTRTLDHYIQAWETTKNAAGGPGKRVADHALAHYSRLLVALGRLDELAALYAEVGERGLDGGALQQRWLRTLEMYAHVRQTPAASYRCGWYVLNEWSVRARGKVMDWQQAEALYAENRLFEGCSMLALGQMAERTGWRLVSVERPTEKRELPVPGIAHFKQGHYVALLAWQQDRVLAYDPICGLRHMRPEVINEESSGRFLVESGAVPAGWRPLTAEEASTTVGRSGAPAADAIVFDDCEEIHCETCPCPVGFGGPGGGGPGGGGPPNRRGNDGKGCSSGTCGDYGFWGERQGPSLEGMARWRVTEPNLNLWLGDEPIACQPTSGPAVAFRLNFKQRDEFSGSTEREDFFGLGPGWNTPWMAYVWDGDYARYGSGAVTVYPAGGGRLRFNFDNVDQTVDTEYDYNARLEVLRDAGTLVGFRLEFPDGRQQKFAYSWTNNRFFLSESVDPQGFKTRFVYQENASPYGLRLTEVRDHNDTLLFSLSYTSRGVYDHLIQTVTDRFSRTAQLSYDTSGRLTSIQDAVSMTSSFAYDANGWPATLTTAYGNTTFTYRQVDIQYDAERGVRITEPNGGSQMYYFKADCIGYYSNTLENLLSQAQYAALMPSSLPDGTMLDTTIGFLNSFYWDQKQSVNVPVPWVGPPWNSFTTNHLNKARMRHWLDRRIGWASPDLAISFERAPSYDDAGATWGQFTWYDYEGKPQAYERGTQIQPSLVARKMPDTTTWYKQITRNSYGRPTLEVEAWVDLDNNSHTRTNSYVYASNDQDLVASFGPGDVRQAGYTYNASYPHQPVAVTNALDEVTLFYYDGSLRTIGVARPSGHNTTNVYGNDGLLATAIDLMGTTPFRTNSYTWSNGRVYSHTDDRGLCITNTWDGLGRLTQVTYPDSSYLAYRYTNAAGVMLLDRTGTRDRLGNWSYTVYNGIRQVTDVVDPLGRVTHYTYCGCGSPESVTSAYGTALALTTSHTYNNQGLLEQTTNPDGSIVFQYHDALGRVVKTTDYWGSTTNYFDNLGRLSVVQNAGGTVLNRTFDDDNRVTGQTGPENVVANMTYDAAGRLRTRSLTGGGTEAWGYTANLAGATSYTNQVSAVTTFAFDAAGRKTNEIQVGLSTNSFSYYGAGDLKTLTDAKGSVTQWKYDTEGRVGEKWYQGQSTADLVYSYSAAGQLTNRFTRTGTGTSTNGYVTGYLFDAAGNLTNVAYASGTTSVTLGYDALNRLTNMVDGVGTTAYSYAMLGNGLSTMTEDGPWASDDITVTNRGGLRGGLKITQPTAQYVVTNQYDGAKRLTTVGGTAGTFNYFYSTALPSGLPLGIALPGGPSITNRYDSLARLTSTELRTNTLLNLHGYQYNNAFQRTWASRTNSASTSWNGYQNLGYDPAGELTNSWAYATDGTPVTSEKWSFGYDPAQNLLKRTNNTTVETFAVNALNQLSTIPSSTPTYDRPGNLMTRAFTASSWVYWNYTYDRENRLTSVATDTSFTPEQSRFKVEFTYDGKSRMRTKRDYTWSAGAWANAGETRYLYDGMLIVQERSIANAPTVTYTRGRDLSGSLAGAGGIGGLLARSSGYSSGSWSTHDFYHADGNGNITAMVNASGTLRAYYRYNPFGRYRASGGAIAGANTMRFSSKPWVAFQSSLTEGLYYYGYRFYDPYLQRWVNGDPIEERGGVNLYGFVRNAPLDRWDSFGEKTEWGGWEFPFDFFDTNCPRDCALETALCGMRAQLFCSIYERRFPPATSTPIYRFCMSSYGAVCLDNLRRCQAWNRRHGFK